jgi:hypothetical protein
MMVMPVLAHDQGISQDQMKEANMKVLDFILEHNTSDVDLDALEDVKKIIDILSSDKNEFRNYYLNLDAARGGKTPHKIYKQVAIDGIPADIHLYPDGSFIIITAQNYIVECDGTKILTEPITSIEEDAPDYVLFSSGKRIFRQFFTGVGNRSQTIKYEIWGLWKVRELVLKTDFFVGSYNITINSVSTHGTRAWYPCIFNGASAEIVSNNTTPAISMGNYNFTDTIHGVPVYSYTEQMEMDIFKTSEGYSVTGWYYSAN